MTIEKTDVYIGSGVINPDVDGFVPVVIDDPIGAPKTLVCEGLSADESLILVCDNYAGDGWEDVPDGKRLIQFNKYQKSVLLTQHGTYGVRGTVQSEVTIYTRETA